MNPDGSVTKPSGSVVPGGPAKPAVAPGNAKPAEVGKSDSPLMPGPADFLVADSVTADEAFNKNGYIGVDPIYQNGATANERPVVDEENPEQPETP